MGINMTNKEYSDYVDNKSPNSKMWKNIIMAFIFGGIICVIGQMFLNYFKSRGVSPDVASAATSVTMIFIGAFLTGINVYEKVAKYGGAGTLVPITGFANSIVASAMEFKTEGHILGIAVKMFSIAGPVLVFGIIASIIAGVFYFFVGV